MELRGCPSTWPHHYGEHWSHLTRLAEAALNVWQVFGENPPQCSINIKWNESEGPVVISRHLIQECSVVWCNVDCGPFLSVLKEGINALESLLADVFKRRELHVTDSYLGQNFLLNTKPLGKKSIQTFMSTNSLRHILEKRFSINWYICRNSCASQGDLSLNPCWQYII